MPSREQNQTPDSGERLPENETAALGALSTWSQLDPSSQVAIGEPKGFWRGLADTVKRSAARALIGVQQVGGDVSALGQELTTVTPLPGEREASQQAVAAEAYRPANAHVRNITTMPRR